MKVALLFYLSMVIIIALETEPSSLPEWWEVSAEDCWLWICKVA